MKSFLISLFIICLSMVSIAEEDKSANETDLPPSPEGFKWERFKEIQAAFLCPNGWHRHQKKGNSSYTYSLSKESVKELGSFETGLTAQAIKNIQRLKGLPPSVFAIEMAQRILEKRENKKISTFDLSNGPFKAFGVRYRNAPDVAKPIIIHQVFIANDKQDTLFIFTFESPEEHWDSAWVFGNRILKQFLIDDEY